MGASVNKVTLLGRLGKDPEVRYTGSGTPVANFSLATDEKYKDRSGEKQQKTEWHNIVVWGPTAENFVGQYLKKGDLVYIEGKLQTRSWEKDGEKKYTTEVVVLDIKGVQSANGGGDSQPQGRPATQQQSRSNGNGRPAPQNVGRPAQTGGRPAQRGGYRGGNGAPATTANQQADDEEIPF